MAAGTAFVKPYTKSVPPPRPGFGDGFSTWSKLVDITGDGIPDNLQFDGNSLYILRDWTHAGTLQRLTDSVLPSKSIETRTVQHPRYQTVFNVEKLWRQDIDVNGDGRIDVIDASEQAGHWVVYLNVPNPSDPGRPQWARFSYSTQALSQQLQSRGFDIDPISPARAANHCTPRHHARVLALGCSGPPLE